MRVDAEQLAALAGLLKAGARGKPGIEAYPDYGRALVTQRKAQPTVAGLTRGAQTGTVGAILGALIARLLSTNPKHVGAGALAGGALGAIPGYQSGKQEALSDYSRLLFLRRRLGINEPGELEALLRHPELAKTFIRE